MSVRPFTADDVRVRCTHCGHECAGADARVVNGGSAFFCRLCWYPAIPIPAYYGLPVVRKPLPTRGTLYRLSRMERGVCKDCGKALGRSKRLCDRCLDRDAARKLAKKRQALQEAS